jgi:hypothetical protein
MLPRVVQTLELPWPVDPGAFFDLLLHQDPTTLIGHLAEKVREAAGCEERCVPVEVHEKNRCGGKRRGECHGR